MLIKMESNNFKDDEITFTNSNIERLKQKYSQEMKNDPENPLKVCMKLIFNSASERNAEKRLDLALDLSKFLTKPDGVMNLFLALIDFDSSSQQVTTLNQRFIAISNIITHLPRLCMPYEDYCANISQQLVTLLINENSEYSQLASIIYKSMLESPHAKNKDIVKVTIAPILRGITTTSAPLTARETILAINSLITNHLPVSNFVDVFPHLFYALICLSKTPSRLKIPLKSTLVSILDGLDSGAACCLLEKVLFYDGTIHKNISTLAEDEEISVQVTDTQFPDETEIRDSEPSETVILSLLESSTKDLFVLEFFFHFKDVMITSQDKSTRQICSSLIEHLLEHSIEEESTKLDLLTIIANNSHRALELILRTLLNYVSVLRLELVDIEVTFEAVCQSMTSCLSILEVLSAISNSDEDRNLLKTKCLPVLRQIQGLLQQGDSQLTPEQLSQSLKTLVDKLERDSNAAGEPTRLTEDDRLVEGEYKAIMRDLNDKLVPIRVHALVRLKQLILANNTYTVSRIPQLYAMVEASIAESEPYVFLASINLVAEMALRKTSEILPSLIQLYARKELDLQHRMNVGEVLVRLTKQLNATMPHYAQQVMNSLFNGCNDEEELMRMSNLVNIGQVCQSLGDSLGSYMIEVLTRVEVAIQSDTVQVKCAAVDLLRTALSGLDRLRVESIQKDLKRVYGLLKQLRCNSVDDQLCVLVDLALDEIDRIARELLNLDVERGQSLVKSIQVLSLLDR